MHNLLLIQEIQNWSFFSWSACSSSRTCDSSPGCMAHFWVNYLGEWKLLPSGRLLWYVPRHRGHWSTGVRNNWGFQMDGLAYLGCIRGYLMRYHSLHWLPHWNGNAISTKFASIAALEVHFGTASVESLINMAIFPFQFVYATELEARQCDGCWWSDTSCWQNVCHWLHQWQTICQHDDISVSVLLCRKACSQTVWLLLMAWHLFTPGYLQPLCWPTLACSNTP